VVAELQLGLGEGPCNGDHRKESTVIGRGGVSIVKSSAQFVKNQGGKNEMVREGTVRHRWSDGVEYAQAII